MIRYAITLASLGITVTVMMPPNMVMEAVNVAEESTEIFNYMESIFGESIQPAKIELKPFELN